MMTDPHLKGTLCITTRKHPCLLLGESFCATGMNIFVHTNTLEPLQADVDQSLKTEPPVEKYRVLS